LSKEKKDSTGTNTLDNLKKKINPEKSGSGKDKKKSKIREYADALIYAAIVAFLIKVFLFEAYRIPTGSMENTLLVGDFLLVTKFTYGATTPRNIPFTNIRIPYFKLPGFKDPERGDVIVFDFPGNRDELESEEVINYIKRCVGLPGDTIYITQKTLHVNGKIFPNPPYANIIGNPLPENMPNPRIFPKNSKWNEDNYGPIRVPKAGDKIIITPENFTSWEYFVMKEGNKIELTSDNRVTVNGEPLPNNEYTVQRDYLFMMGDNRGNSLDSRFWGFMPVENVVGEALAIYWSWDPAIPFYDIFRLIGSVRWDRVGKLIN
jgi:signal peptidase I, bacterial type